MPRTLAISFPPPLCHHVILASTLPRPSWSAFVFVSSPPPPLPHPLPPQLPSRAAASYVVIAMGTLWVALGGALLYLGSEVLHDASSRLAYLVLAVACLTMAAFTTYGLAGHLRHAPALAAGSDDDSDSGRRARAPPSAWRFFQPFRGGAWFVATQALGWALFSAGLTLMLYLIAQGAAGVMEGARRYTWTAGAIMVTAQLVRDVGKGGRVGMGDEVPWRPGGAPE